MLEINVNRELYKTPDLEMEIEMKRLEWFGECNYNGSNKGS
jgi:hypothetical protein